MADRRMPWFPVDVVDLLTRGDFSNLTDTEMGCLIRAAAYFWLHGEMPSGGESDAVASSRMRPLAVAWITEIHAAQTARFEAVSTRNKANAKARWNKEKHATRMRPHATRYHREGEVEVKRDTTTTTTTPSPSGFEFDLFWSAYPKKLGKGAAEKWWKKNKPDANLTAKMLATLAWQVKSDGWAKDGGQYVPNPATWLNQSRWQDEPQSGNGKSMIERAKERFLSNMQQPLEGKKDDHAK